MKNVMKTIVSVGDDRGDHALRDGERRARADGELADAAVVTAFFTFSTMW